MTPIARACLLAFALLRLDTQGSMAATYGDLSGAGGPAPMPYPAGPYAAAPGSAFGSAFGPAALPPISGGPEGVLPAPLDAPGAASLPSPWTSPAPNLPLGRDAALPHGRLQVWSFGQVNSTTDPFNAAGLSTPFMFVPWSTPLSGWSNAQTWNWWRERAGVQPPYW
jgi:hypothetical protein